MILYIKGTLLIKAYIAKRHRSPEEDDVTWSLTSNKNSKLFQFINFWRMVYLEHIIKGFGNQIFL
jgi:hypothetical protein